MDAILRDLSNIGDPRVLMLLVGAAAMAVGLVAHAILFAVLRRLARLSVVASEMVRFVKRPARLLIPLFALRLAMELSPGMPEIGVGVQASVTLLVVAAVTWLAARTIAGVSAGVIALNPLDAGDNLDARRVQTQTRVLARIAKSFVVLIGLASALMVFPGVRQLGASLLASAGVVGLVAGIAARSVLGNLIAGLQIALTQPIRLDDVVVIDGEWGRIQEIGSTFVVVRIWDDRRLVVPLQWLIEHPFQNWTRTSSQLLGTVTLWVDYRVPMAPLREALERICRGAPEWDGRVAQIDVVEAGERALNVRALISAADSSKAWDLRCKVREGLIDFLQRQYPDALPRIRTEWIGAGTQADATAAASAAGGEPGPR